MTSPWTESVVLYYAFPTKQGFHHRLDDLTIRDAYAAWAAFLEACTAVGSIRSHFDVRSKTFLTPEPHLEPAISAAFPIDGPSDIPLGKDCRPVPKMRIAEAVDLLAELTPSAVDKWGNMNARLWVRADFELCGRNGQVWPGQDRELFGNFLTSGGFELGSSHSFLELGARQGMSLCLSLPNATDDDIDLLIPWLQAHLPFTLRADRWSRWTLTKGGHSYRGRKLFR